MDWRAIDTNIPTNTIKYVLSHFSNVNIIIYNIGTHPVTSYVSQNKDFQYTDREKLPTTMNNKIIGNFGATLHWSGAILNNDVLSNTQCRYCQSNRFFYYKLYL